MMTILPKPRNTVLQAAFPDQDVSVIEGEFIPDEPPDETEALRIPDWTRFLNEGPQRIRQMLAETDDPERQRLLRSALRYWGESEERAFETGEPREAIRASSFQELVGKPVEHVMVGDLGRPPLLSEEVADPDSLKWLGIIDFDFLMDPDQ